MDVQTISMPPEEAKERLKAYRRHLHRKADAEFEAIAAGYEKLAEGRPLIDVEIALQNCPRDAKNRPRLAIARSDRREVRYWRRNGMDTFGSDAFASSWNSPPQRQGRPFADLRRAFRVPLPTSAQIEDGYAMVPIVPPDALESAGRPALRRCFTLWEVEEWQERTRMRPDRDPFLLQQLGGTLYVVLAEWDLTELERAVMAGRRPTT
jgi:hypothetical protein